jgi:hypothetical protein
MPDKLVVASFPSAHDLDGSNFLPQMILLTFSSYKLKFPTNLSEEQEARRLHLERSS